MRRVINYRSLETEYEVILEQDDLFPIAPSNITETQDGRAYEASRGIWHNDLISFTHHYKCEIISIDSDPGN